MKFLALLLAFSGLANAGTKTWQNEVDAEDLWVYTTTTEADAAVEAFKTKCATEVIERTNARLESIEMDPNDFVITTKSYSKKIPNWGFSWRCMMNVTISPNLEYNFSKVILSPTYRDILEPTTGRMIQSSVDQCKAFMASLETTAPTIKLFHRNAMIEWVKNPRTGKEIGVCFVKYYRLLQTR